MLTGLRKIAEVHKGDMRLTANQNVIVANVAKKSAPRSRRSSHEYRLVQPASGLRRNSMACVALPTCGLALAESERYLPDLITALDERLSAHGLGDDDIVIRMTGCPNGCARPYLAEIGLVGKGPGRYNLYLGAAFDGSRMSKLYAEDLQHDADHRDARSGVRRVREGARAGRALRRVRDPRGLCCAHRQRRGLPCQHGRAESRVSDRSPTEARPPRMEALARLPVFYALTGKRAVVAGGSAAAAWKAELLAAAGAAVDVYAADPSDGMIEIAAQASIIIHRREIKAADLAGAAMAVGAYEDDSEAAVFAAMARHAGVPVNVIDKPAFCDFSFGAIVNRSPLVIGISTDGAAPVFGQAIRAKLEALIPRGFARWAQAARQWRPRVQALALSFRERRRFWERFTERAVAEPERAPDERDIDALTAETRGIGGDSGSVVLVGAGPGDPELLTLRAVRALQSADVILIDDLVTPRCSTSRGARRRR